MRRKILLTTTLSLLTITSTIAASVPAFAADISQISITGMDNLSQETQLKINDAFKNVSDDVIRLYNAIGGEVNFVDELLDRGMGKQQDLMDCISWIIPIFRYALMTPLKTIRIHTFREVSCTKSAISFTIKRRHFLAANLKRCFSHVILTEPVFAGML